MSLLWLLVVIILFGCLYWIINRIPMAGDTKRTVLIVLLAFAAIVVLFMLLHMFGGMLNQRIG